MALWRKVLAVAFLVAVVGPLLFAMFYSVLTGASFGQVFGSVAFLWPYLGFVVPLGMVVGLFDLLHRRRRPPEVDAEESEED